MPPCTPAAAVLTVSPCCCSRDLKLDNTLLSDDKPPLIKLCDFGFSRKMEVDTLMYTHIGYDAAISHHDPSCIVTCCMPGIRLALATEGMTH